MQSTSYGRRLAVGRGRPEGTEGVRGALGPSWRHTRCGAELPPGATHLDVGGLRGVGVKPSQGKGSPCWPDARMLRSPRRGTRTRSTVEPCCCCHSHSQVPTWLSKALFGSLLPPASSGRVWSSPPGFDHMLVRCFSASSLLRGGGAPRWEGPSSPLPLPGAAALRSVSFAVGLERLRSRPSQVVGGRVGGRSCILVVLGLPPLRIDHRHLLVPVADPLLVWWRC